MKIFWRNMTNYHKIPSIRISPRRLIVLWGYLSEVIYDHLRLQTNVYILGCNNAMFTMFTCKQLFTSIRLNLYYVRLFTINKFCRDIPGDNLAVFSYILC